MPFRLEYAVGHCSGGLFLATNEFTKKRQVCSSAFVFIACTAPITPDLRPLLQPLPTPAAIVSFALCSVLYISYQKMTMRPSNPSCLGLEIPFLPPSTIPVANKIMFLSKILTNPAELDWWMQRVMCDGTCHRATAGTHQVCSMPPLAVLWP